ncbi:MULTISPECIES: cytochrome P450 [unclassified Pseudofrankia]|uniref:cytochrome P450 n=1 Tax=unclassified Pseudofrankia TaxID=2994372 RepID=UPI0008DA5D38|nr:hypothetical protein BCD48_42465 [Pseudofrankia sp. BMG5.36]
MATQLFANEHPLTTDKDISSEAFWRKTFRERDKTFAWLRRKAPVSWHRPLEDPVLPPEIHGEAGFWAVTKAEDIRFVGLNHELFSNALGGISLRPMLPAMTQSASFLEMDPPDHTRYRQIMSAAFTPRAVARVNAKIEERARQIVGGLVGAGDFDVVEDLSARLPMLTVADLIGVPEGLTQTFADAGEKFIGALTNPESRPEGVSLSEFAGEQLGILRDIGVDLVNFRRTRPGDDIATALANAQFDGRRLSDEEITSIMRLLSIAGNDTTKQTTSWTVLALDRNPEQRAWLLEDFDGRIAGAIEEFVRYACPVLQFARTATQDVELGGQQIRQGDKVAVFYCSGNRDEAVFEDPHRFDLSRGRTPHVGFGGGGIHYCLGNGIAKAELRALFGEILTQLPKLQVTGEPDLLFGEFSSGIRHLSARTN